MEISLIIILGCLAMTVLAIGIILFVVAYQRKAIAHQKAENDFQQQLIEATLITEQNEREKISRNLHDDLGTSLNIIKLHFEKIKRNPDKTEIVTNVSEQAMELILQSIADLRSISRDLMPATLTTLGLMAAIRDLCRHVNDTQEILMTHHLPEEFKKPEDKIQTQIYRICQEITNNLIKHAKPTKINLVITNLHNGLNICFYHNGTGISNEEIKDIYNQSRGIGLKSLESRLRMINGKINYIKELDGNPAIEIQALLNENTPLPKQK